MPPDPIAIQRARALADLTPEETLTVAASISGLAPSIPFAPPEEAIVFWVRWGGLRGVGCARSILARQWEQLDRDRLDEVARRLGVADAVEQLAAEVEAELDRLDRGPA